MFSKKLLVPLILGLSAHGAWASSDYSCEPNWTLNQHTYNRCSSLPFLTPSNDTRLNFKLLLVDDDFATLRDTPLGKTEAEPDYGKVPFSLETFENNLFESKSSSDSSDSSGNEENSISSGTGTRCISNDTGAADFIEALAQSDALPTAERQLLTEERQKLSPSCVDVPTSTTAKPVTISTIDTKKITSPAGTQFLRYLAAATAFYEGRYDQAASDFGSLYNSDQPWLRESARYMSGRTELNHAQQQAFDSYGFPQLENVDQKMLLAADTKFNAYLKEYPGGSYAQSARGLLRRVYWLSNQLQKLADEYDWQLNHPTSPQHNLTLEALAQEADQKLLATADPQQIKNPLLLATLDLALMRPSESSGTKQISFADLQKQQSIFAEHKTLYEYLLAAHRFYVQKDAAQALKALPETIPTHMTYLDFSRLVVRGLALEATRDHPGARKLWLSLVPLAKQPLQNETLQLALALNYEHSNQLHLVFEPKSPITEPIIRSILMRSGASAELLRHIITSKDTSRQERDIALYTLLYKDLLQGQYQNYLLDYRLLPGDAAKHTFSVSMEYDGKPALALFSWSGKKSSDSYSCPSTLDIAKTLAKNPNDPHGLICLGDFVNANDLESGIPLSRYAAPRSSASNMTVLGSAPSRFSGKIFSRAASYKTILANPNATPDQKAYALYRSIQCYATMGSNHCGGDDIEKSARKSWFRTLKSTYRDTIWAKSLKYYW